MSLRPTSWSVVFRHQPVGPAIAKCGRELTQIAILGGGMLVTLATMFGWEEQFHGSPIGFAGGIERIHTAKYPLPWRNRCPWMDFECSKKIGQKNGEEYPRFSWIWGNELKSADAHHHH